MQAQFYNNYNTPQPSLLRQIVDEVDGLSDEQKIDLLHNLKVQKVSVLVQRADAIFLNKPTEMTEEEIWEMVSSNRKKWYEDKNG